MVAVVTTLVVDWFFWICTECKISHFLLYRDSFKLERRALVLHWFCTRSAVRNSAALRMGRSQRVLLTEQNQPVRVGFVPLLCCPALVVSPGRWERCLFVVLAVRVSVPVRWLLSAASFDLQRWIKGSSPPQHLSLSSLDVKSPSNIKTPLLRPVIPGCPCRGPR